jgi:hypothetical protein
LHRDNHVSTAAMDLTKQCPVTSTTLFAVVKTAQQPSTIGNNVLIKTDLGYSTSRVAELEAAYRETLTSPVIQLGRHLFPPTPFAPRLPELKLPTVLVACSESWLVHFMNIAHAEEQAGRSTNVSHALSLRVTELEVGFCTALEATDLASRRGR